MQNGIDYSELDISEYARSNLKKNNLGRRRKEVRPAFYPHEDEMMKRNLKKRGLERVADYIYALIKIDKDKLPKGIHKKYFPKKKQCVRRDLYYKTVFHDNEYDNLKIQAEKRGCKAIRKYIESLINQDNSLIEKWEKEYEKLR